MEKSPPKDPVGDKYNSASMAASEGRWRLSADNYLQAFSEASAAHPLKLSSLSGYSSVLREGHFVATDEDMKQLKFIAESKKATALQKAMAFFARGYLRFNSGDREGAVRDYRRAIAAAESPSPREERSTVILPNKSLGTFAPTSVKKLLEETAQGARENLDILMNGRQTTDAAAADMSQGWGAGSRSTRHTGFIMGPNVPSDPAALQALRDEFDERNKAGGLTCDACGKIPEPQTKLHRCSSCKAAFYCNAECQKNAWALGHKKWCRKPGVYKAGDWVRVGGCQNTETGPANTQVLSVVEATEAGIRVECVGSDGTTVLFPSEVVEHIRPKM